MAVVVSSATKTTSPKNMNNNFYIVSVLFFPLSRTPRLHVQCTSYSHGAIFSFWRNLPNVSIAFLASIFLDNLVFFRQRQFSKYCWGSKYGSPSLWQREEFANSALGLARPPLNLQHGPRCITYWASFLGSGKAIVSENRGGCYVLLFMTNPTAVSR